MRRLVPAVVVAMLVTSGVAWGVAPGFASGSTTRVSVASDGTPANAGTNGYVISQDGRYVVFASMATNLDPRSTMIRLEVYRHDRVTGLTELVSLNRSGTPTAAAFAPTLSADGRFVAFQSSGSDLVANDTIGSMDVFVRDMTTGTTVAASTDATGAFVTGGGTLANFPGARAISDDGRYVVFASSAQLVAEPNNGVAQIYVKDLSTGAVVRASVDATGAAGNGMSDQAVISGDGHVVAFRSTSTNLSPLATGTTQIFTRDLVTGTTTLESLSADGMAADQGASLPGLSRDGRYLVFETASKLTSADADGNFDVYLRDRAAGTTTLASPSNGVADSRAPSITADGSYVAFYSSDSALVSGDVNNVSDIYLWNRMTGALTLVSLNDAGEQANDASSSPSVSANAGSVLFSSSASNLVSSPVTTTQQLYVRDLASDQAPVVAPLADAAVDEGVTFTATGSFSDPDGSTSWTATVDWGDGAGAQPLVVAQDKTFTLSKLLAPGTYAVTVCVTDGEGLAGTGAFHLTVANVAPTVDAGGDAQVGFGTTFTGGGSFSDPGTAEQYAATVDYGDGSGVMPLALAPERTFALSHTYAEAGTYTVTVSVTDGNAGTGSDTLTVAVLNDTFTWLSPTPASANAGRTVPVRFTVTAPDGSFVLDQSVRVELLDASGDTVNGPYVWSSTPSAGVSASDAVYAVNIDTSKDEAGIYTVRVSFSSLALTGSFSRALTLTPSTALPQRTPR